MKNILSLLLAALALPALAQTNTNTAPTPTPTPTPIAKPTPSAAHYWLGIPAPSGKTPRYASTDLGPVSLTSSSGTVTTNAAPAVTGIGKVTSSTGAPADTAWDTAFNNTALGNAQAAQVAKIEAAFNAQVAGGVDCSAALGQAAGTFILAIDTASQNKLTSFVTLVTAEEANSASGVTPSSGTVLFDIHGNAVGMTNAQAVAAAVLAGSTYQQWLYAKATKEAAVNAATSVAAVQAITYP